MSAGGDPGAGGGGPPGGPPGGAGELPPMGAPLIFPQMPLTCAADWSQAVFTWLPYSVLWVHFFITLFRKWDKLPAKTLPALNIFASVIGICCMVLMLPPILTTQALQARANMQIASGWLSYAMVTEFHLLLVQVEKSAGVPSNKKWWIFTLVQQFIGILQATIFGVFEPCMMILMLLPTDLTGTPFPGVPPQEIAVMKFIALLETPEAHETYAMTLFGLFMALGSVPMYFLYKAYKYTKEASAEDQDSTAKARIKTILICLLTIVVSQMGGMAVVPELFGPQVSEGVIEALKFVQLSFAVISLGLAVIVFMRISSTPASSQTQVAMAPQEKEKEVPATA